MSEQRNGPREEEVFQTQLASIVDRPLDPRSIDTYADDILNDLIAFSSEVRDRYAAIDGRAYSSLKDVEDAAFAHFDLEDMDELLDFVQRKADAIHSLDAVIGKATEVNKVITPPETESSLSQGYEPFEPKEIIPKLKTTLFVLLNNFEIDVADPDQLRLTRGVLDQRMMRRQSYYMLEVLKIDRIALVCDEGDNVTFVFDTARLKELGISASDLADLPKPDLEDIIKNEPNSGKRFIYSKNYAGRMLDALQDPTTANRPEPPDNGELRLVVAAPENYLSTKGLCAKLGVGSVAIKKVLEELGEALGETRPYKFGSKTTVGYSPQQQAMIETAIEADGPRTMPDGYLNTRNIASITGLDWPLVNKVIESLGEELGEVYKYRSAGKLVSAFSPEQQDLILENIQIIPDAPEGYLSRTGINAATGFSHDLLRKAIAAVRDELGEPTILKGKTGVGTEFFSPEKQEIIMDYLSREGFLASDAPEGYLTVAGIASHFGISSNAVNTATEVIGEELGPAHRYKVQSHVALTYSPDQIAKIREHLELNKKLAGRPPEGFMSIRRVATQYGHSTDTVWKALDELEDELGEIADHKYGSVVTKSLSPEQQQILIRHMEKI